MPPWRSIFTVSNLGSVGAFNLAAGFVRRFAVVLAFALVLLADLDFVVARAIVSPLFFIMPPITAVISQYLICSSKDVLSRHLRCQSGLVRLIAAPPCPRLCPSFKPSIQ
jgi:hypothetical protein